jgi:hypothetical protein
MIEVLNESAAEIFAVVMSGVVIYLSALAREWSKSMVAKTESFLDEEARYRLHEAIERAIAFAETEAGEVDLYKAVKYVQEFNPGDLARFGVDGSKLFTRIKGAAASRSKRKPDVVAVEAHPLDI